MRDATFRYLPPRQRDIDWGLHVSGAGAARIRPGESYPPAGHPELYGFSWSRGRTLPEFSIIWISEGEGVFESLVTGEQPVTAGTAMLLFPGMWHRYRPLPSTGWTEWWVAFSGEHVERLIAKQFFSAQQPLLRPKHPGSLLAIFEKTVRHVHEVSDGDGPVLAAHVLEILALLAKDGQSPRCLPKAPRSLAIPAASDRHVTEALQIIWTESHAELTVRRLARRLGLSARSLERRFHRCLNRTIRDAIRECRVARAEQLLAETNLPITSIVTAAGFCSYDGMRRALMKSNGHAPSRLRTLLQQRAEEPAATEHASPARRPVRRR
ncbi:MAG: helix-turn-helix domain-containing protein [Planctomycetota bacterium]